MCLLLYNVCSKECFLLHSWIGFYPKYKLCLCNSIARWPSHFRPMVRLASKLNKISLVWKVNPFIKKHSGQKFCIGYICKLSCQGEIFLNKYILGSQKATEQFGFQPTILVVIYTHSVDLLVVLGKMCYHNTELLAVLF